MKRFALAKLSMCALLACGAGMACMAVQAAPAPITQLFVAKVDSQQGGAEYVEGDSSASRHHGGGYVQISTVERGVGQAWATMNGAQLRLVSIDNVCFTGDYWDACRNGQTVEGRLRVWDATGKGNGTFQVWARSHNAPYNTMSRSFSVP